jgi:hypothetical protein
MECERQRKGVGPRGLGCGEPVVMEKVLVSLAEITDMHH